MDQKTRAKVTFSPMLNGKRLKPKPFWLTGAARLVAAAVGLGALAVIWWAP